MGWGEWQLSSGKLRVVYHLLFLETPSIAKLYRSGPL